MSKQQKQIDNILFKCKNPRLPHRCTVKLPCAKSSFKVKISGKIASDARQFAIHMQEGNKILFRFNPRFPGFRTMLNASNNANQRCGLEQDTIFPSLKPDSKFKLKILALQNVFYVQVNQEKFSFTSEIVPSELWRTIVIHEVEFEDVHIDKILIVFIEHDQSSSDDDDDEWDFEVDSDNASTVDDVPQGDKEVTSDKKTPGTRATSTSSDEESGTCGLSDIFCGLRSTCKCNCDGCSSCSCDSD